jgi:hypothetical protein
MTAKFSRTFAGILLAGLILATFGCTSPPEKGSDSYSKDKGQYEEPKAEGSGY